MSGATSSRSCATSSRSRSGSPASKKRKDVRVRAHAAAEDRVVDALVGATASASTKESFRKKLRAGELDDKEIEVEMQASGSGMPMFEIPGTARRPDGRDLDRRHFRQARRRPHQDAPGAGEGLLRAPDQRGVRQAARPGPAGAGGDPGGREQRHRVPRRDRQDLRPRRPRSAPTCRARACSAIFCR